MHGGKSSPPCCASVKLPEGPVAASPEEMESACSTATPKINLPLWFLSTLSKCGSRMRNYMQVGSLSYSYILHSCFCSGNERFQVALGVKKSKAVYWLHVAVGGSEDQRLPDFLVAVVVRRCCCWFVRATPEVTPILATRLIKITPMMCCCRGPPRHTGSRLLLEACPSIIKMEKFNLQKKEEDIIFYFLQLLLEAIAIRGSKLQAPPPSTSSSSSENSNLNPKAKNPTTRSYFLKRFKRLKALETWPRVLGRFLLRRGVAGLHAMGLVCSGLQKQERWADGAALGHAMSGGFGR
nr:hypothetical protein Itr_chr07CG09430 [Ipomoea trifida]